MKRLAIFALLAIGTSAHALLIDGFKTGLYHASINTNAEANTSAAADAIGGDRHTFFFAPSNPHNLYFGLTVENGFFVDAPTGCVVRSSTNWGRGHDLDLDLGSNKIIRLNFLGNDQDQRFAVTLWKSGGTGYQLELPVAGGRADTPFSVDFDFSPYIGADKIQKIDFDSYGAPSGDFGLQSIEAVPEPASMAVLGLGLFGLISRRRNRR